MTEDGPSEGARELAEALGVGMSGGFAQLAREAGDPWGDTPLTVSRPSWPTLVGACFFVNAETLVPGVLLVVEVEGERLRYPVSIRQAEVLAMLLDVAIVDAKARAMSPDDYEV